MRLWTCERAQSKAKNKSGGVKAERERWAEESEKRWRKIDQNKTEGNEPTLPHRIHSWCRSQPEGSRKTQRHVHHGNGHRHTRGAHINIGLLSAQTHGRRKTHAGGTAECSVPICCAPGPLSGGPQSGIQPCQDWHPSHSHPHLRSLRAPHYRGSLCVFVYVCALPLFSTFADHKRQTLRGTCERHRSPSHRRREERAAIIIGETRAAVHVSVPARAPPVIVLMPLSVEGEPGMLEINDMWKERLHSDTLCLADYFLQII